ncbi:MAG: PilZ domain-containing protein [Oligoflexia bacterium]|nr:PilZ domain-containing protein [Oligoflexia bacterium]
MSDIDSNNNNKDKNTFFIKLPTEDRTALIDKLKTEAFSAQICLKGGKPIEKFYSTLTQKEINRNQNDPNIVLVKPREFSVTIFNISVLMNLTVDKIQYFATASIKLTMDNLYAITFDPEIFKIEKRKNFRLKASKQSELFFHIEGKRFHSPDVSAGGISFYVEDAEKEKYAKGALFENCFVEINDVKYVILQVEIVNVIETQKFDQTKIGVKFLKCSPTVESQLCRHINQEIFRNRMHAI